MYLLVIGLAVCATLVAIFIRVHEKYTNAMCKSTKRLNGKTVLVTGGTAGMGLEMSKDFARRGARVIIACPFAHEGTDAQKNIIEETGNNNVSFKFLDLASTASIQEFAGIILKSETRLDILINNAGILLPDNILTKDGMNIVMQINYFGLVLLTFILLPLLKKTGTSEEPSRIVNTSSVLHNFGKVDFENWNRLGYWHKYKVYCNSKLCVVMFTRTLSSKLAEAKENVLVNSVDPGAVGTGIYDTNGIFIGIFMRVLFVSLFKNPWEGAQTALHVALDDKAGKISGKHLKNCNLTRAVYTAYDDILCAQLWVETCKLLKLNQDII